MILFGVKDTFADAKIEHKELFSFATDTKGSLTQAQAVRLYGCYRLSAKILEFRKQGYNIETQYKTAKTRYGTHTTYANYILMENENEKG